MTEFNKKKFVKRLMVAILYFVIVTTAYCGLSPSISPTKSMYPTIPSPCLNFHKVMFNIEIQRGMIISINMNDEQSLQLNLNETSKICKRVIGLPGEKIQIIDGKVYINDSATPLDEPYLPEDYIPTGNFGPYYVPDGCVFLLGDNRDQSFDSRYLNDPYFQIEGGDVEQPWFCINSDGITFVK